jgi:hypothetical protein
MTTLTDSVSGMGKVYALVAAFALLPACGRPDARRAQARTDPYMRSPSTMVDAGNSMTN